MKTQDVLRRAAMAIGGLLPPVLIAFFVVVVLAATIAGGGEPDDHMVVSENVLRAVLGAVLIATVVVVPLYVKHARGNRELGTQQRKRWLFSLTLYAPFAMPVYWWRYLRARGSMAD